MPLLIMLTMKMMDDIVEADVDVDDDYGGGYVYDSRTRW